MQIISGEKEVQRLIKDWMELHIQWYQIIGRLIQTGQKSILILDKKKLWPHSLIFYLPVKLEKMKHFFQSREKKNCSVSEHMQMKQVKIKINQDAERKEKTPTSNQTQCFM